MNPMNNINKRAIPAVTVSVVVTTTQQDRTSAIIHKTTIFFTIINPKKCQYNSLIWDFSANSKQFQIENC
jgi:hypothetical protein